MRYGHRNDAGIPVQLKVSGGTAETSLLRKGRPWNLFRPCSGFSQENGTGAHTLYRIYRFGRAILLLNRVKILKKRCYEAQKEEISPYTEAKRSVEKQFQAIRVLHMALQQSIKPYVAQNQATSTPF